MIGIILTAALIAAAILSIGAWIAAARRDASRFGVADDIVAPNMVEPTKFSLERYQPMERLLSDDDFQFLTQRPGYRSEMGTRWKKERRRIFRLYLNDLKLDFHHLHATARAMVSSADAQSAPLVRDLIAQRFIFWRSMTLLEIQLTLGPIVSTAGAHGLGRVDARPLLALVESMRVGVAQLTPQASAA